MTEKSLPIRFLPAGWRQELDLFLAERAAGMNANALSQRRIESVMALNALSDGDLAAMGLRRRDIPAFVFEDMLPEPG